MSYSIKIVTRCMLLLAIFNMPSTFAAEQNSTTSPPTTSQKPPLETSTIKSATLTTTKTSNASSLATTLIPTQRNIFSAIGSRSMTASKKTNKPFHRFRQIKYTQISYDKRIAAPPLPGSSGGPPLPVNSASQGSSSSSSSSFHSSFSENSPPQSNSFSSSSKFHNTFGNPPNIPSFQQSIDGGFKIPNSFPFSMPVPPGFGPGTPNFVFGRKKRSPTAPHDATDELDGTEIGSVYNKRKTRGSTASQTVSAKNIMDSFTSSRSRKRRSHSAHFWSRLRRNAKYNQAKNSAGNKPSAQTSTAATSKNTKSHNEKAVATAAKTSTSPTNRKKLAPSPQAAKKLPSKPETKETRRLRKPSDVRQPPAPRLTAKVGKPMETQYDSDMGPEENINEENKKLEASNKPDLSKSSDKLDEAQSGKGAISFRIHTVSNDLIQNSEEKDLVSKGQYHRLSGSKDPLENSEEKDLDPKGQYHRLSESKDPLENSEDEDVASKGQYQLSESNDPSENFEDQDVASKGQYQLSESNDPNENSENEEAPFKEQYHSSESNERPSIERQGPSLDQSEEMETEDVSEETRNDSGTPEASQEDETHANNDLQRDSEMKQDLIKKIRSFIDSYSGSDMPKPPPEQLDELETFDLALLNTTYNNILQATSKTKNLKPRRKWDSKNQSWMKPSKEPQADVRRDKTINLASRLVSSVLNKKTRTKANTSEPSGLKKSSSFKGNLVYPISSDRLGHMVTGTPVFYPSNPGQFNQNSPIWKQLQSIPGIRYMANTRPHAWNSFNSPPPVLRPVWYQPIFPLGPPPHSLIPQRQLPGAYNPWPLTARRIGMGPGSKDTLGAWNALPQPQSADDTDLEGQFMQSQDYAYDPALRISDIMNWANYLRHVKQPKKAPVRASTPKTETVSESQEDEALPVRKIASEVSGALAPVLSSSISIEERSVPIFKPRNTDKRSIETFRKQLDPGHNPYPHQVAPANQGQAIQPRPKRSALSKLTEGFSTELRQEKADFKPRTRALRSFQNELANFDVFIQRAPSIPSFNNVPPTSNFGFATANIPSFPETFPGPPQVQFGPTQPPHLKGMFPGIQGRAALGAFNGNSVVMAGGASMPRASVSSVQLNPYINTVQGGAPSFGRAAFPGAGIEMANFQMLPLQPYFYGNQPAGGTNNIQSIMPRLDPLKFMHFQPPPQFNSVTNFQDTSHSYMRSNFQTNFPPQLQVSSVPRMDVFLHPPSLSSLGQSGSENGFINLGSGGVPPTQVFSNLNGPPTIQLLAPSGGFTGNVYNHEVSHPGQSFQQSSNSHSYSSHSFVESNRNVNFSSRNNFGYPDNLLPTHSSNSAILERHQEQIPQIIVTESIFSKPAITAPTDRHLPVEIETPTSKALETHAVVFVTDRMSLPVEPTTLSVTRFTETSGTTTLTPNPLPTTTTKTPTSKALETHAVQTDRISLPVAPDTPSGARFTETTVTTTLARNPLTSNTTKTPTSKALETHAVVTERDLLPAAPVTPSGTRFTETSGTTTVAPKPMSTTTIKIAFPFLPTTEKPETTTSATSKMSKSSSYSISEPPIRMIQGSWMDSGIPMDEKDILKTLDNYPLESVNWFNAPEPEPGISKDTDPAQQTGSLPFKNLNKLSPILNSDKMVMVNGHMLNHEAKNGQHYFNFQGFVETPNRGSQPTESEQIPKDGGSKTPIDGSISILQLALSPKKPK